MSQTNTAAVKTEELSLQQLADPTAVEKQIANLDELTNQKLKEYYERRDELRKRITDLTKTGNQKAIEAAKADLGTVEQEIAKRAQNIGIIMAGIGQEMGMLDTLGERLMEDSPEDIAKREAAQAKFKKAEKAVIDAKAAKQAAEMQLPTLQDELQKAEGTWDPFGLDVFKKLEKVTTARRNLRSAQAKSDVNLTELEEAVEAARANIASVEEEIAVDKDVRIKELNLDRLYALLTDGEAKVSAIVRENISALETNITTTEEQLQFNRDLRVSSAEELEQLEATIAEKRRAWEAIKDELADLVGQETSPRYQELQNEQARLGTELDTHTSEKRLVEGKISMAQVNVSELESSMAALRSDLLLAKSNYNDFVLTAEKARVAGSNIALLLKTQAAKTAADSLGRGRDAMTLAALDASIATDVANKNTMATNAERRVSLLDEMAERISAGAAVAAEHDARYAQGTEEYKDKYGKLNKDRRGTSGDDAAGDETADQNEKPELF